MYYPRVLPLLARMSAAGAAWAAVLIVGLLFGARLLPLGVAATVAGLLTLPGFAVGVSAAVSSPSDNRKAKIKQLDGQLPRWARTLWRVLFYAFWLAGATAFLGIAGVAEIQNGQYVLNNHGAVTVVDKTAYDSQLAKEEQIFLGVLGAFGVRGAALIAAVVSGARSTAAQG